MGSALQRALQLLCFFSASHVVCLISRRWVVDALSLFDSRSLRRYIGGAGLFILSIIAPMDSPMCRMEKDWTSYSPSQKYLMNSIQLKVGRIAGK